MVDLFVTPFCCHYRPLLPRVDLKGIESRSAAFHSLQHRSTDINRKPWRAQLGGSPQAKIKAGFRWPSYRK
jgi:hypothetical protein